nr:MULTISPECIES: hypothetical protein [unclassified Mycolicibacterium]
MAVPIAEVSDSVVGCSCAQDSGVVGAARDAVVGSAPVGAGDFDCCDNPGMPVEVDTDQDAASFVRVRLCCNSCHGGARGLSDP